jgi:type IV pilus assembly protein PilA
MSLRRAAERCLGFTIIELTAVIAVTLLVGVVGYSAFYTHRVRSQVASGVNAARATQQAVVHMFRKTGEVPASAAQLRGDSADGGLFIASIAVDNGRIDLVFGQAADRAISGRRLSLTPYEAATAEIVWVCGNDIPKPGEHPLGFAGGGPQAQQISTTIAPRYLPAECR